MGEFRFQGHRNRSIYQPLESCNSALCSLEKVLVTSELPYVYTEMPNFCILAMAATKIGYLPFEEFSIPKSRGKQRRQGRGDLWLATKGSTRADYFEVKYIKVSFGSKRLAMIVRRHLDVAHKDATDTTDKTASTTAVFNTSN